MIKKLSFILLNRGCTNNIKYVKNKIIKGFKITQ